jgi:prevent-host-death family protein
MTEGGPMSERDLGRVEIVVKTTNEVRNNLVEIIEAIEDQGQRVVVRRYKEPVVVIVSADDYEWFMSLEESIRDNNPGLFDELYEKHREYADTRKQIKQQQAEQEQSLRETQEQRRRLAERNRLLRQLH